MSTDIGDKVTDNNYKHTNLTVIVANIQKLRNCSILVRGQWNSDVTFSHASSQIPLKP